MTDIEREYRKWLNHPEAHMAKPEPSSLERQAADALVAWRNHYSSQGLTMVRLVADSPECDMWTLAGQIIEARKQLPPTADPKR